MFNSFKRFIRPLPSSVTINMYFPLAKLPFISNDVANINIWKQHRKFGCVLIHNEKQDTYQAILFTDKGMLSADISQDPTTFTVTLSNVQQYNNIVKQAGSQADWQLLAKKFTRAINLSPPNKSSSSSTQDEQVNLPHHKL